VRSTIDMDIILGHVSRKGAAKVPFTKLTTSWRHHPPNAQLAYPDWILANHLEDSYWGAFEDESDYDDGGPQCVAPGMLNWKACLTNNGHSTISRIPLVTKASRMVRGEKKRSKWRKNHRRRRANARTKPKPTSESKADTSRERKHSQSKTPRVVRGTMTCVAVYNATIHKRRTEANANQLCRGWQRSQCRK
jgi:hypothetical protein